MGCYSRDCKFGVTELLFVVLGTLQTSKDKKWPNKAKEHLYAA
jgi:hypothetical protein